MFASTVTMGSTSAGNSTFLIRLPPAISVLDDSRTDDENHVHGRMPQNMKSAYGSMSRIVRAHQDLREHERIDQEQQERVEERPEEAENRTAVAGLQITDHERLDQPAVSKQRCEISKRDHRLCGFRPAVCWSVRSMASRARSKSISCGTDAHHFLGSLHARFGARLVEILGALGDLREHRHRVRQHFDEADRHHQVMLLGRPAGTTSRRCAATVKNGVCPGSTPKSPSLPGSDT